jgi:predicted transcriptional regulator with HTH domain
VTEALLGLIFTILFGMSVEPNVERIIHVLARSKIRMRILNFLAENSGLSFNAHEIAVALDISYDNVQGALNGAGKKYRVEDSLVSMGLVSRTEPELKNNTMYTVTALGFNATAAAR